MGEIDSRMALDIAGVLLNSPISLMMTMASAISRALVLLRN